MVGNGDMGPAEIREICALDDAGTGPLRAAMQQMRLSASVYYRVLKLARTIGDLAGCERIETPHLAKASRAHPMTNGRPRPLVQGCLWPPSIQHRPRRQV